LFVDHGCGDVAVVFVDELGEAGGVAVDTDFRLGEQLQQRLRGVDVVGVEDPVGDLDADGGLRAGLRAAGVEVAAAGAADRDGTALLLGALAA
jgi:hypothetical protein